MNVVLWFDGGCIPNPGQMYGSYQLNMPDFRLFRRIQLGVGTSNQAEYLMLLEGLRTLVREMAQQKISARTVTLSIHSDSALVCNQVQGLWKCDNDALRGFRDEAQFILKHFKEVDWTWHLRAEVEEVLGH